MNPLILFVWAAGAAQLIIAASNVVLPGKLRYRENLNRVAPLIRQIFVVHSIYLVLILIGFSGLCFLFASRLVGNDPLGRSLSGFLALFWLLRIVLQLFYYDADYRRQHRLADVAYTLACCFLGGVFAVVTIGMSR